MLLAARGAEVTIYESQPTVGGRTSRLTLESGAGGETGAFHFDRGPTFFLMPYVLEEIFAATGRTLTDYADLTRLDPMYRLVIGRGGGASVTLDTTQDRALMMERIAAIEPADGPGFERFMADNRKKLAVFEPVLRRGFRGLTDLVNADMIKAGPYLNPHQSVHTHLGRYFKSREVRLAMTFQSKYLGMSPMECPSLFSILPFIEHEYGVWHPRGGCNALMAAMAGALTEMGGRIHCGRAVRGIEFEGRRATGVRLDSGVQRHDHVVVNADAAWAIKNLIPASLRPDSMLGAIDGNSISDARMDAKRYSCSTYMLYLGLRERVDLPHHTISISGQYEQNLADIGAGRLSEEPSLYVCNPSRTDPTLAPEGCSALYVLVPTANLKSSGGTIDWKRDVAGVRKQALARVSGLIGRDIVPLIVAERAYTPEDWRGMNIQYGATFNLAHNLMQMLHMRPRHELQGVEGVWMVGGGTHPGSGLPVIFLSSQITAGMLAERMGLGERGGGRVAERVRCAGGAIKELKGTPAPGVVAGV